MTYEDPHPPLRSVDRVILNFIRRGLNYKQIGEVLNITPAKAHFRGSDARQRFAALDNIPVETPALDKHRGNSTREPRISDQERIRLNEYFERTAPPVPENLEETLMAKLNLRPPMPQ